MSLHDDDEPKFMGFDEWEISNAARELTTVIGFTPKKLKAVKAWIVKNQKAEDKAVKLTENL